MGWIILIVVLISIGLEVLIGLKRGIILSGIRLGFTVIGTVVAALIAKSLTAKIIFAVAKSQGITGANLATVGKELMDKLISQANLGSALGPHAAGLAMSAAVPFLFVVLFLIFKLLTLFLFLIAKACLKKPLKTDEPKPTWSKTSGAVLGGIVGLVSCAIVLAPIHGIFRQIAQSGAVDDVCDMLETKANVGPSITNMVKKSTKSLGKSPSAYLFRYTGAEALSNAVVSGLSTVTPKDIGSMGTSTKYDLQNSLGELLKFVKPVGKALPIIESLTAKDKSADVTSLLTSENIDIINGVIDTILDTKLLADADKVALVKSIQPLIDKGVKSALGQKDDAPSILGDVTDIKALKENINKTIDVVASLADLAQSIKDTNPDPDKQPDPEDPLGLKDLDVEAILDQPEKIDKLIDNVFKLDAGPDMIASLVNESVASAAGEEFKDIISADKLKEVGAEKVREAVDSILPLTDLIKSGEYTADDVSKIDDKIDELAKLNILSPEDQEALKDYFKPNK